MTPPPRQNPLLLPDRARLFHIGLPKTGTTTLQNTAADRRSELLRLGVRYPGRTFNHRREISSFMGRGWGWGAKPTLQNWQALMAEIDADTERRIWFGHEFASEASERTVERFRETLGDRVHVVITLRHYGSILASSWQQYMKMGDTIDFESWLRAVLSDPPDRSVTHTFHVRNDQGLVVSRWAKLLGKENVTAIVTDKKRPALLTEAFEDLLGLPRDLLAGTRQDGFSANRGLSVQEAELLRRVNVSVRENKLPWKSYERLVRDGAAGRMLRSRVPGEHDEAPQLPRWAAERAMQRANEYTDQIEASGVRIVGDTTVLREPVTGTDSAINEVDVVPLDAAVGAVLGAVKAGAKAVNRESAKTSVEETPASELAVELTKRARRKAVRMLKGRRG